MLPTSKNVLFLGPNHLLTTGADDPSVQLSAGAHAILNVLSHQHRWLACGYDLEIEHFQKFLVWWLPSA